VRIPKFIASIITGGAILGIASVHAADLPSPYNLKAPVAPADSWTGFYLGAGAGFRSANVDAQTKSGVASFGGVVVNDFMSSANCAVFGTPCGIAQSLNNTAFRFSPYVGYNWQVDPRWLVGVEGDAGFGGGSSTINGAPLPGVGQFSPTNAAGDSFMVKTGWDASARARIGYLVTPAVLVYVTGGAAWQHVEAISTCGPNNHIPCGGPQTLNPGSISDSATKLGYAVGGGLETMIWGHWLLRADYRYSDFGTITATDVRTQQNPGGLVDVVTSYKLHVSTQTALAGIAYKF
jgi:outer membrane immunogenic protein